MRLDRIVRTTVILFGLTFFVPTELRAHCDSLDGPVVKAAQKALETRNPALVLIWVDANAEPEIVAAFEQALAVRTLSPAARELADRSFFETVVRLHRAGEGEPFTGLKLAGNDVGPAILAADAALDDGSVEHVVRLLTTAMKERLFEKFNEAVAAKRFKPDDVAAEREYVRAYVEFIHYVEQLYEWSLGSSQGHSDPAH